MSDLYQAVGSKISQGDILDVVHHVFLPGADSTASEQESFEKIGQAQSGSVLTRYRAAKALILTHDCMIDKPSTKQWQVCPVVPISQLNGNQHGDVRKNRIFQFLHLPARGDSLPESIVDFSIVTTVDPAIVRNAKRIVTLSNLGRQALYAQYIRWITRWELKSITCPACKTEFDASLALPVFDG